MALHPTSQEASLAATGETPEIADQQAQSAAGSGTPEQGKPSTDMEEILPAIRDLAVRVGGVDRLAAIIATLQGTKE